MKSEIDVLMETNQIDALLVTGDASHNPAMYYLTGGGHITHADLIKPAHQPATLFCNAMEREEAARTGLNVRSFSEYPLNDLLADTGGNSAGIQAARYSRMFADMGLTKGKIAIYGQIEIGPFFDTVQRLHSLLPQLEFIGFNEDPILLNAMMTKEPAEIDRIRSVGKITTEVVARTAEFLVNQKALDGVLMESSGKPVTIGKVKQLIDLWLAELGAENPEGTIFAIGRDAGVPHSTGNPSDLLRLGETIVFDIFPCEHGGGYFYDFTRTWSLGYATDQVMQMYEQVLSVYNQIVSELAVNAPFKRYQQRTCELFEAQGHPSIQSTPGTQEGYVHSLGHGIGLRVHEMPFSGSLASPKDILAPGTTFTLEPGLYYPSRGCGIRLENSYTTRPDGKFEILADYPMDLVLPLKH